MQTFVDESGWLSCCVSNLVLEMMDKKQKRNWRKIRSSGVHNVRIIQENTGVIHQETTFKVFQICVITMVVHLVRDHISEARIRATLEAHIWYISCVQTIYEYHMYSIFQIVTYGFPWSRFIVLLKQEQGPKISDDDSFSKHRGQLLNVENRA